MEAPPPSAVFETAKALLAQQHREALTEELREEVRALREKNRGLQRNWDDAELRLDANVDDRERVIAHKSAVIEDLDERNKRLGAELEAARAKHEADVERVRVAHLEESAAQSALVKAMTAELGDLREFQEQKAALEGELGATNARFEACVARARGASRAARARALSTRLDPRGGGEAPPRAPAPSPPRSPRAPPRYVGMHEREVAALQEQMKLADVKWASEMRHRSAEDHAKLRATIEQDVFRQFQAVQLEHGQMKSELRSVSDARARAARAARATRARDVAGI